MFSKIILTLKSSFFKVEDIIVRKEELPDINMFLFKNCFNKIFFISFEYTCFLKIIWIKKMEVGMIEWYSNKIPA